MFLRGAASRELLLAFCAPKIQGFRASLWLRGLAGAQDGFSDQREEGNPEKSRP